MQGFVAEPKLDARASLFYLPLCGAAAATGRQQLAAVLADDKPIVIFDVQREYN